MSRFIEVRHRVIVNVEHIIYAGYVRYESDSGPTCEYVVHLSNGYKITVDEPAQQFIKKLLAVQPDHSKTQQFIEKLLTNQTDQSTIKINQDSNQPEKGKK